MIVFQIAVKIMARVLIKSMIIHVYVCPGILVCKRLYLRDNLEVFYVLGKFCEEELNWCSEKLNPCRNNGRCLRTDTGYK